ncbi:gluconate 2-dehydrogenase subunit 3 family protein [Halobacteriales archaeon Cl-PHB]
MELTRRDAVAALAASGIAVGGVVALGWDDLTGKEGSSIGDHEAATLESLAEVLYPSDVSNVPEFVEGYVAGKLERRPERAEAVATAIEALDEYTQFWWDDRFVALSPSTRETALEQMGVDGAEADPAGTDVERVRYHLVNDLLFALYASPTGGRLLGIENPPGHPGGHASYQRGPNGG